MATTASLGIFWVANQQLPVFDWHYLFGYATVLLVSLHLAFNFPRVWRFFFARRPDRGQEPSPTRGPAGAIVTRRNLLGTLGVLAATGAAFVLGLRHGRSELKVEASAGGGAAPAAGTMTAPAVVGGADATALAIVERFHAFSSHTRAGVLTRAASGGWGEPPPPFKGHAGAPRTRLPLPGAGRPAAFDLASLAAILWHTAGVTERRGGLALRASPSSGALFATELYVLARSLPGLAPGVLHYDPETHALERLGAAAIDALPPGAVDGDAPAFVIATAIFQRSGHKYRDRTYRYVLADLGHALENLRVAAGALVVPAHLVAAFDETRLAAALGVDERRRACWRSSRSASGQAPARRRRQRSRQDSSLLAAAQVARWQIAPPSSASALASTLPGEAPGVTAAVHVATSLRTAASPASPLAATGATTRVAPATTETVVALPAVEPAAHEGLRVIAARRSVRRFSAAPLPLPALAAVLARMATGTGPLLSHAVRIDVVVHAVEGLQPGAYRYRPAGHALERRRALPAAGRAATRAAALDQDVIGDAAAVFVLAIDRAAFAADPLGRGARLSARLSRSRAGRRARVPRGRGAGARRLCGRRLL